MRKNASKIMKLIFFTFCIVFVPLAIEKIIMFEKINLVNSLNGFSKETWFGFIGSYLGAIGTIILGYITFYQNKNIKNYQIGQTNILWNYKRNEKFSGKNVQI